MRLASRPPAPVAAPRSDPITCSGDGSPGSYGFPIRSSGAPPAFSLRAARDIPATPGHCRGVPRSARGEPSGVRLLPTRPAVRSRYAASRARRIVPLMRTRFRTLAALLALMAFSASFAEQVWASTCAPVEASPSGESAPASHPHGGHGGMEMPADHHDPRIPSSDDAECPVQAVAAGCALVFFPSATMDAVPAAPAADPRVAPHADPSIQLLLVSSHFRPPQR